MSIYFYYFDGSNGVVDADNAFDGDTLAFDGSTAGSSNAETTTTGSKTSNFLLGKGTGPRPDTTTDLITQVRYRMFAGADGLNSTVYATVYTDDLGEELFNQSRTFITAPNYTTWEIVPPTYWRLDFREIR